MSTVYLSLQHCRALGFCLWGVRRFCTRHGLDFKKLADGKMTTDEFINTGEHQALKVVELADKECNA